VDALDGSQARLESGTRFSMEPWGWRVFVEASR
jgi:hypothetical protein